MMRSLGTPGSHRRALSLSLFVCGLCWLVVGGIAFLSQQPDASGLSSMQIVLATLTALGGGVLWLLHDRLSEHFEDLERLRAAVLVASAQTVGALPPAGKGGTASASEESGRLREAVEVLIARRLYPNASVDERLHAVLGALDEAILVITTHGQVSLVNEAAKAVLGEERLTIGTSAFAALDRDLLIAGIAEVEQSEGPVNWTLRDVEGNPYGAKLAPLRGHSGIVVRLSLESLGRRMPSSARDRTIVCLTSHRQQLNAQPLRHGGRVEHDFTLHDEVPVAMMGPDTPLDDLPVFVFDAESTGLDVKQDRIVQLGGVRVHGGRIFPIATIDRLINPGRPIPPAATAVHGICDEMVAKASPFPKAWPALEPLMRGAVLVGHNIGYDWAMVQRECMLASIPFQPPPMLDTMLLAGLLLPDIGQLNLENVAAALGVDIHGRHTALGDALVTAEIYVRMIPLLQSNGARTYAQAYAFTRRATHLIARQRAMGW